MRGKELLLLLAAFVLLGSCQQKPKVSMSPPLTQVYSGDFFYLLCESSSRGVKVKWFFNNHEQPHETNQMWRIAAARPEHSGSYHCTVDSVQSDRVNINVLGFFPRASLKLDTGQPVMRPGSSVTLQIENEDGLQGWLCWVYKGEKTKKIRLRLSDDAVGLPFTPSRLVDRESIFWCTDTQQQQRSNQIIVRVSDKPVSLEMYPFPALAGDSVTLRCLVWGTDQISHADFFLNNSDLQRSRKPTYEIPHVTDSAKGRYKCAAFFTHTVDSAGLDTQQGTSDVQDLEVYEIQTRAELSAASSNHLSCGCPHCPQSGPSVLYRWYNYDDSSGRWSLLLKDSNGSMWLESVGTYSCRAVWENGMSLFSKSYTHKHPNDPTVLIVIIVITTLVVLVVLAGAVRCHQQRHERGAIYDELALQSQGKDYEGLRRPHGSQQEAEYETLQPGAASRKRDDGGYEALRTEEGKHEIYHTLQMVEAGSGNKEYEQLRGEGRKQDVYHTLHKEGEGSGVK